MKKIILILILFVPVFGFAQTNPTWQIPLNLSNSNTKVRFEVDTTWHMVHGEVKSVTGKIALQDPADPLSISADIKIPVKKITTGWGMRDSSFMDSMKEEEFPEISFKSTSFIPKGDCSVEAITAKNCSGVLKGKLKILDVESDADLEVKITKNNDMYLVKGNITFAWAKFNVKDPSIMMAKVKPDVTVFCEVSLPALTQ